MKKGIPIEVIVEAISTFEWQHPVPSDDVHKYKHWSTDVDPVEVVVYPDEHWIQVLPLI